MRRFLVALGLLALALTACELRAEINVNPSGSGSMGFEFGIEKSLLQAIPGAAGQDPFAQATKDLGNDPVAWKVERFDKGGLAGIRATFQFSDIADLLRKAEALNQSGSSQGPGFKGLVLGKTASGWEFRAHAEAPDMGSLGGSLGGSFGGQSPPTMPTMPPMPTGFPGMPTIPSMPTAIPSMPSFDPGAMLGNAFDLQFRVTLPGKAAANNADTVERHGGSTTFVWKVGGRMSAGELSATTTGFGGGGFPVVPVAAGAGVVALGAAALVLRHRAQAPSPVLEGIAPPLPPGPPKPADPSAAPNSSTGPADGAPTDGPSGA